MSVCLDLSSMTLTGLGLDIAITGDWAVIPDLLTLEDIGLWFLLSFQGTAPRLHFGLTARGRMPGDLELTASATYPDPVIALSVSEPQSLRGRETSDLGPLRLDGGGVRLRDARAQYTVRDAAFSAGFSLETDLHVPDPRPGRDQLPLALTEVEFRLSGHAGQPIDAQLTATAAMGSARAAITASHEGGHWLLGAQLLHADFGELGDWLHEEFGIRMPEALTTLRLDRAELSYRPGGTRQLDFVCDGRLRLFEHDAVFSATVDLTEGKASFDGTLRLDLTSAEGQPHPMELRAHFGEENGASTLRAAWSDPSGVPVTALLPEELSARMPGAKTLRVNEVSLAYSADTKSRVLGLTAGDFSLVAIDQPTPA
jgi:hypothetical protein